MRALLSVSLLAVILINKPLICSWDGNRQGSCTVQDDKQTHTCRITQQTKIVTDTEVPVVVINKDGTCDLVRVK